ncbi:lycopene cyclase domain-containing protein [Microbacterium halophytorum]|uniref:lycopene cyclase domain-containing protein n=1 Tax=Microbacterium halophytorum TaxID=2067568 RepID=UPI000CFCA2B4|nr:lycopene cyclase domain-containing protein [Microbacterium halophytorum]
MTYALMSLPFIGAGLVVFVVGAVHAHRRGSARRYLTSWAAATAALLVLTAVFDNVMMAAGFFGYGSEQISGLRLVLMPVEDFLYPIAGALLLSGVWQLLDGQRGPRGHSDD